MDRSEIFEKIVRLEMNVNQLSEETSELRVLTVELVEENVAPQLESDNLKKVLGNDKPTAIDTANSKSTKVVKKLLPNKDSLAILYGEGFHIYKGELFGKHRHGEDCLFCSEVLSD